MVKYHCQKCGRETEYDPKTAHRLRDIRESEQAGRDVVYLVTKCALCGARNQMKPPPGSA